MKRLKVVIKDQFDQESIALAKVRPANDQKLELYKSVEHIEIDDDIILPNMDLLYEKADSSGKCNSIKTSHNFTRCIPT